MKLCLSVGKKDKKVFGVEFAASLVDDGQTAPCDHENLVSPLMGIAAVAQNEKAMKNDPGLVQPRMGQFRNKSGTLSEIVAHSKLDSSSEEQRRETEESEVVQSKHVEAFPNQNDLLSTVDRDDYGSTPGNF